MRAPERVFPCLGLVLPAHPGLRVRLAHLVFRRGQFRVPVLLAHRVLPVLPEAAWRQVPWRYCLSPVQGCSDCNPPKPAPQRKR